MTQEGLAQEAMVGIASDSAQMNSTVDEPRLDTVRRLAGLLVCVRAGSHSGREWNMTQQVAWEVESDGGHQW